MDEQQTRASIAAWQQTINTAYGRVTGAIPAPPKHGLGFDASAKGPAGLPLAQAVQPRAGQPPASFDLTRYALPPGDQGQVGSCVTWATGYTGYGILMNEEGINGSPMAPMYIYSQIAKGNDVGTSADVALPMEQQQGIDTKTDYAQGDFDYTDQPTDAERANAAHYKLSGSTDISQGDVRTNIENAVSQGEPVPFGFQARQSFMDLNQSTASGYTYQPGNDSTDPIVGGHEVTIVGYNDQGVKVENSWGSSWGDNGYVTLPWKFFESGDVNEIHAMGKLVKD